MEFKLVTDCAAFKQRVSKVDLPRDVIQWIMYLQDFNYTVEHRPTNRMKHVDALSRYPANVYVISSEITARLHRLQQTDEQIKAITTVLRSHQYEDYKMKGRLLYKSVNGNDLLVVPKALEKEVIKKLARKMSFCNSNK